MAKIEKPKMSNLKIKKRKMKNEKLKNLLRTANINNIEGFEILNSSTESLLKGGLACFTCGDFKCKNGFAAG